MKGHSWVETKALSVMRPSWVCTCCGLSVESHHMPDDHNGFVRVSTAYGWSYAPIKQGGTGSETPVVPGDCDLVLTQSMMAL